MKDKIKYQVGIVKKVVCIALALVIAMSCLPFFGAVVAQASGGETRFLTYNMIMNRSFVSPGVSDAWSIHNRGNPVSMGGVSYEHAIISANDNQTRHSTAILYRLPWQPHMH